ncbi:hypothetical protein [Actinomadura sp. KC345]|uniref:hypothetical protein n=1 Tax=Actinomadura sp. KC345 TaxID=2530371 RepID=UPI001A9D33EE|nr:hypothetical protein [Actinomadura sp. KC345]
MDDSAPAVRSGGIVGVLAAAGIVAALMQTLVVPFIGDMPRLLDTSASNAWSSPPPCWPARCPSR